MVNKTIQKVDGLLLVFSVANKGTFEYAKQRYENLSRKNIPVILVGNMVDLVEKRNKEGVSKETAENLANSWKIDYIETSAISKPVS